MGELKSWAKEQPDAGRHFLAYGRYDDEPTLCEMTDHGPEQSTFNMEIEYMSYGEGGFLRSEMDFQYGVLWCYVPAVPNWDAMSDGEKEALIPTPGLRGG